MSIYTTRSIMKESVPILVALIVIEIFGGHILNSRLELFIKLPILLVCIPVINGIGGNVGSVLGARLSSALHTGYIKPKFSGKRLKSNVFTSLLLGFITFIFLSFLIACILLLLNIKVNISVIRLIAVVIGAGLMLTMIVTASTVLLSIISFKAKLDPDNVVIPVLTTIADISGICCLVLMFWVVGI